MKKQNRHSRLLYLAMRLRFYGGWLETKAGLRNCWTSSKQILQEWWSKTDLATMEAQNWFGHNGSPKLIWQQWWFKTHLATMVVQNWFGNNDGSKLIWQQCLLIWQECLLIWQQCLPSCHTIGSAFLWDILQTSKPCDTYCTWSYLEDFPPVE